MTEIILHHFDASPFAEKVRLALGLKRLSWHSVQIPMVMPKPDLMPLTGGYRKTPVMQIGADIYCDTRLIARELERRYPEPALFPGASEGLCMALSCWSDQAFFGPGAALSMATNRELPEAVIADRRRFFSFLDFDKLQEDIPHFYSQFSVHLHWLEMMLADGRAYLLGHERSWADILAFFPVWMARGNVTGTDELLAPLGCLQAWMERVSGFGHGHRGELEAGDALKIALQSESRVQSQVDRTSFTDLEAGDAVTVTPDDYGGVPVAGRLERLTTADIAVRRTADEVAEVVVHFPRAGYRVEKQA